MPVNGQPSARALELQKYMSSLGYVAYSFDLAGNDLKTGILGSFKVEHANVLFKHKDEHEPA